VWKRVIECVVTWITEAGDQGCVWLVGRRSVCGHRLRLMPLGCTSALSVT